MARRVMPWTVSKLPSMPAAISDKLSWWKPRREILEQVKALLVVREQFVSSESGASQCAGSPATQDRSYPVWGTSLCQRLIEQLKKQIKAIDERNSSSDRKRSQPQGNAVAASLCAWCGFALGRSLPPLGTILAGLQSSGFLSGHCAQRAFEWNLRLNKHDTSRHFGHP